MNTKWLFALTFGSTLGCGLIAGIFYAFSSFVMKALAQLAPPAGIAAMQSINIVVINRWFLGVFFGTAVASFVLIAVAAPAWRTPRAACLISGSLIYLCGTVLVTIFGNVPWNDALAAVDPASSSSEKLWADYLRVWTTWNHVRCVAALVAATVLTLAMCFPFADEAS